MIKLIEIIKMRIFTGISKHCGKFLFIFFLDYLLCVLSEEVCKSQMIWLQLTSGFLHRFMPNS